MPRPDPRRSHATRPAPAARERSTSSATAARGPNPSSPRSARTFPFQFPGSKLPSALAEIYSPTAGGKHERTYDGAIGALVIVLSTLAVPVAAGAQDETPTIVVQDGVTQPVFGYDDAIRERVWVESNFDSDFNGVNDRIAIDIMRPRATEQGLKVPVVMDASPYYTTLGRGNEGELKQDTDGDGILDRWPLFYDNYFVPRGYAVVSSTWSARALHRLPGNRRHRRTTERKGGDRLAQRARYRATTPTAT